ncbi:hypothetical protein JOB18_016462 [Solea senegalensis]|uniref:Uncharacterized protein n=1 Tax=Solea senegalensis TaxID=28829 RepID=A0AAV6SXX2_SOLSE|nr:hypothetical protein JOB18_016462 [Solea senegalensis]
MKQYHTHFAAGLSQIGSPKALAADKKKGQKQFWFEKERLKNNHYEGQTCQNNILCKQVINLCKNTILNIIAASG